MNKPFFFPCLKRILPCLTLGLLVSLMAGCGAPSTASYLERAARDTDCAEAVYHYRTTILSAKNDDKLQSDYVDKAVAGLRATVPSCSTDPAKVIDYTQQAATDLAKARPKDAIEVANMVVSYMDSRPHAFVSISGSLLALAKDTGHAALWTRIYAIGLDRGTWSPRDISSLTYPFAVMPEEQKVFLPQLERLRDLLQAASDRAAAATTAKCDLKYCQFSNGSLTSVHEQVVVYQRAYAAELVRLGLGDSNRVAIVNGLADATARRLAADNARRTQYAAQAAADARSSTNLLNTLASVAGGIAAAAPNRTTGAARLPATAISGGKTAPPWQAAATAPQGGTGMTTSAGGGTGATSITSNLAKPSAGTTAPQSKSQQWISEPSSNACVRFDTTSNKTFMFLVNSCGYKVAVNFCFTGRGVRSSDCARNDVGLEFVRPHDRSSVAGPMMDVKGPYKEHWFACKDPAGPYVTGNANGLSGECRRRGS
ncbi:hypothetical protein [Polaromonas sp. UC242_47]|uniref:hypothetical protein n=1 Tax=Polaromonas sp. UC242_47 TaxID=3374626 RepID=UPI0037997463